MAATSILLLEDSLELGALTIDVLQRAGYESVRHVVSNQDAIAALEDEGFDLCIFDMRLQGETCEPAMDAAQLHDVPIILTSGSTIDLPVLAKSHAFLAKPTAQENLTEAIEKILDTG